MVEPRIIAQIRAIDNGAWDMGMADFSSNAWCVRNGESNLLVVIEDELKFRHMEGN